MRVSEMALICMVIILLGFVLQVQPSLADDMTTDQFKAQIKGKIYFWDYPRLAQTNDWSRDTNFMQYYNKNTKHVIYLHLNSDFTVRKVEFRQYCSFIESIPESVANDALGKLRYTAITPILTTIEVLPLTAMLSTTDPPKQFTATAYDQDGNAMPDVTVTWYSSNEAVGTINSGGLFTAKAEGETIIEAESSGIKGTARVTVLSPVVPLPSLSSISVSPPSTTLNVEEKQQFTATAYDQFGNEMLDVTVIWSSSDPTVGTIDANGLFTAKAAGKTTIEAASGGKKGTAKVTVSQEKPIMSRIVLSPASVTLEVGDVQQFHATAYDQFGNEMPDVTVIWSSSDETVGTIDANNGLFTAKAAGTTTIEAVSGGKKGTASVTVENSPPVPSFTYTPSRPKEGETVTFNASDSYDLDGHITKYEWDFGDEKTKKGGEEVVTHTYTCVGTRTVKLKVTDDKGASNTTEKSIEVNRLQETQEIPLNGIVKFTEPGIKEVIPEIFIRKPADGNITITIYNTSENEPIIEIETPESIKDSPVDITFNVSKKWRKGNGYKKENVLLSCGSNDKRVKLKWIGTVDGYEQYKAILFEFPSQKYQIVGERESVSPNDFIPIIIPTCMFLVFILTMYGTRHIGKKTTLIGLLAVIVASVVLSLLWYYIILIL